MKYYELEDVKTFYHGSRMGLNGDIHPQSSSQCDFGQGFYMSTSIWTPMEQIYNSENAQLSDLELCLSELRIGEIETPVEWALLIGLCTGALESYKETHIYKQLQKLLKNCDIVISKSMDPVSTEIVSNFFKGEITDYAMINALLNARLEPQYVAMTDKACSRIQVVHSEKAPNQLKEFFSKILPDDYKKRREAVNLICKRYCLEGKFIDELMQSEDLDCYDWNSFEGEFDCQ